MAQLQTGKLDTHVIPVLTSTNLVKVCELSNLFMTVFTTESDIFSYFSKKNI